MTAEDLLKHYLERRTLFNELWRKAGPLAGPLPILLYNEVEELEYKLIELGVEYPPMFEKEKK